MSTIISVDALSGEPDDVPIRFTAGGARRLLLCCTELNDDKVQTISCKQLERFNVWASNNRVFAPSRASLDYRLRAAPTAKAAVEAGLENLSERLLTILVGGSDISDEKLRIFADLDLHEIDPFARDLMKDAISNPNNQLDVLGAVESVITRLHQTSLSIRHANNQNTLTTVPELVDEDEGYNIFEEQYRVAPVRFKTSSAFREFVEQVIRKRWSIPELEEEQTCSPWFEEYRDTLLRRCTEMIATRRRQFVYFRSHQTKLQSNDPSREEPAVEEHPTSQTTSNLWQSSKPDSQDLSMLGGVASRQNDAAASKSQNFFVPLEAPLNIQISSTPSSEGEELHDTGYFELPPPPKLAHWESEKACPYCCLVLPRDTYVERNKYKYWRRHVVDDMQPYICLFHHCYAAGKTYRTLAEWQMHLQRSHVSHWTCPLEHDDESDPTLDRFTYETVSDFESHLIYDHPGLSHGQVLRLVMTAAQKEDLPDQCFVCLKRFTETTAELDMQRHIANHLQAIFVLALPWRDDIQPVKVVCSNRMNSSVGPDLHGPHNHEIGHLFESTEEEGSPQPGKSPDFTFTECHQFGNQLIELTRMEDSQSRVSSWVAGLGD